MKRGKCDSYLWSRHAKPRGRIPDLAKTLFLMSGIAMLVLSAGQPPTTEQGPMIPQGKRMDVQRAAAYMIESLGGDVVYDFEDFDGGNVPNVRPERKLVDRLFESSDPDERPKIIYAVLAGRHVTDNEMMLLRYLPDLVGLSIEEPLLHFVWKGSRSIPPQQR